MNKLIHCKCFDYTEELVAEVDLSVKPVANEFIEVDGEAYLITRVTHTQYGLKLDIEG